ncbi:MAG: hypothetical protein AAGD92_05425 [Pseudomonadota bacterium]
MAEFHQKRMATQTWFEFDDNELTYRIRDNSGDHSFEIEYAAIPSKRRSVFERNNWLRNVGLIWCALGVIEIALAIAGLRSFSGSAFWLLIGLGCLGFYRLTWSQYTVFDTDEGSIWILNDRSHNEIESKIDEERKRHLLAWYRNIDFGHDTEREVQTVEWLAKRDALTHKEAQARISELRANKQTLISEDIEKSPDTKLH